MMMSKLTKAQFLKEHLLEQRSYDEILKRYPQDCSLHQKLQSWYAQGGDLLNGMRVANKVYTSKVLACTKRYESGKTLVNEFQYFIDIGRTEFYNWFSALERKCVYCGIDEYMLQKIFGAGPNQIRTKRSRGPKLELERRNAQTNLYNKENCVLACYVCNNHKSDLINEEDHRKYFASKIREYLTDKYNLANK